MKIFPLLVYFLTSSVEFVSINFLIKNAWEWFHNQLSLSFKCCHFSIQEYVWRGPGSIRTTRIGSKCSRRLRCCGHHCWYIPGLISISNQSGSPHHLLLELTSRYMSVGEPDYSNPALGRSYEKIMFSFGQCNKYRTQPPPNLSRLVHFFETPKTLIWRTF